MNGTVLIVGDESVGASVLAERLRAHGYNASDVRSAHDCLERLVNEDVDVVIADIEMPGTSGIELCRTLRDRHPDLVPLVITARGRTDTAIAAIRAGAYDYLTKPVTIDELELAVARALEHLTLQREVRRLLRATPGGTIEGIVGESRPIRSMLEMVRRVAGSDSTLLISGESGTGKELVAGALHQLSSRRDQPFVAVNCGAMPAPLLESELFGHVRGAFTDARSARGGLFAQAGKGTIFLDEISEMPLEMQVKLLRVLQEHTARPVGGDAEVRFDARVLVSTNRDLELEVEENRFRKDLYYRINAVEIVVPPLRDRGGDVLLLAHYFLRKIAERIAKPVQGITGPAARLLSSYDWPGNVRELENCLERAVALCSRDEITIADLPERLHAHHRASSTFGTRSAEEMVTLAEMERRYVRQVLAAVGGNKSRAARVLGLDRRSVYRRLEQSDSSPETETNDGSADARPRQQTNGAA